MVLAQASLKCPEASFSCTPALPRPQCAVFGSSFSGILTAVNLVRLGADPASRRGTYWETIAVPELRGQARRVAETLLGQSPASTPTPVMMEYMM